MNQTAYDLALVGTGFASSFFLHEFLRHSGPAARVLVLERGQRHDHAWHLAHRGDLRRDADAAVDRRASPKPWVFSLAFGGGSNCWWACTPRMLPADFELRTRYGVGDDWPITYDDLEEAYADAEDLLQVSGPSSDSPFPRSRPYPQPPHRFSLPDQRLKARFPGAFFVQPTARARRGLPGGRPRCCANIVCEGCPIDAKFTVLNSMPGLYRDPRVHLVLDADARRVEIQAGVATGVCWIREGREETADADCVALGANAVFNPHILRQSGLDHPQLGRGLMEQASALVHVNLAGLANTGYSTSITGSGYMIYDGPHRSRHAAALAETVNLPRLRDVRGKWLHSMTMKFVFEDLRQPENRVAENPEDPHRPSLVWRGHSPYAQAGLRALDGLLPTILEALPVESYRIVTDPSSTENHILGTAVMGRNPNDSLVDGVLLHHRVRNLWVLGSSAFPTASPANPTLTICALALRAARLAFGRGGA